MASYRSVTCDSAMIATLENRKQFISVTLAHQQQNSIYADEIEGDGERYDEDVVDLMKLRTLVFAVGCVIR